MKYSQRAKREVPVYRIVWSVYGLNLLRMDWEYVYMDGKFGICYRVK